MAIESLRSAVTVSVISMTIIFSDHPSTIERQQCKVSGIQEFQRVLKLKLSLYGKT